MGIFKESQTERNYTDFKIFTFTARFDDDKALFDFLDAASYIFEDKRNKVYFDGQLLIWMYDYNVKEMAPIIIATEIDYIQRIFASSGKESYVFLDFVKADFHIPFIIQNEKNLSEIFNAIAPKIQSHENLPAATENFVTKGFYYISAAERLVIDIHISETSVIEKRTRLFNSKKTKDHVVIENINDLQYVSLSHFEEGDDFECFVYMHPSKGKKRYVNLTSFADAFDFILELKARVPHLKLIV